MPRRPSKSPRAAGFLPAPAHRRRHAGQQRTRARGDSSPPTTGPPRAVHLPVTPPTRPSNTASWEARSTCCRSRSRCRSSAAGEGNARPHLRILTGSRAIAVRSCPCTWPGPRHAALPRTGWCRSVRLHSSRGRRRPCRSRTRSGTVVRKRHSILRHSCGSCR